MQLYVYIPTNCGNKLYWKFLYSLDKMNVDETCVPCRTSHWNIYQYKFHWMISRGFKWYWVKLMKKSQLCIRFSQPHDFANGPDLIAQWHNRPAKLLWNPLTKIRTYIYHAWNILFRNGYSVTNYYDSIEITFYSTYFHHVARWNLWSSGSIQHGTADRDSETQILRGESVRSRDRDMGENGVIFLFKEIRLHL